jgi:hypothetical protein
MAPRVGSNLRPIAHGILASRQSGYGSPRRQHAMIPISEREQSQPPRERRDGQLPVESEHQANRPNVEPVGRAVTQLVSGHCPGLGSDNLEFPIIHWPPNDKGRESRRASLRCMCLLARRMASKCNAPIRKCKNAANFIGRFVRILVRSGSGACRCGERTHVVEYTRLKR